MAPALLPIEEVHAAADGWGEETASPSRSAGHSLDAAESGNRRAMDRGGRRLAAPPRAGGDRRTPRQRGARALRFFRPELGAHGLGLRVLGIEAGQELPA